MSHGLYIYAHMYNIPRSIKIDTYFFGPFFLRYPYYYIYNLINDNRRTYVCSIIFIYAAVQVLYSTTHTHVRIGFMGRAAAEGFQETDSPGQE